MNTLIQFKNMINELQRCRMNVKKQIDEFNLLQNEIKELHDKANQDPDALHKLTKFNNVINSEDTKKIIKQSEEVKHVFNQLKKQFAQLSVDNIEEKNANLILEKKKNITKKQYRNFV
ncbi:hypothetical protein [Providencia rettgeri]|uniref:hypothetical protein n=1 Tax=Providencia rettgeri TaxID=587 RepID=UPI0034E0AB02